MPPEKFTGLGSCWSTSSFLISPRCDAGHVAALVDVRQDQPPRRLRQIDPRGNHRARAAGRPAVAARGTPAPPLGLRQLVDRARCCPWPSITKSPVALGDQEAVLAEGVGVLPVAASRLLADLRGAAATCRARGSDRPRRPGRGARAGRGPARTTPPPCRVPGIGLASSMAMPPKHVAEEDRLARAVGVHRPQVVEMDLAAVDVLPAHVEDRGRRAAPTACCRGRCCWRACGRSCRRRRSGRASPRGVYQQLTNRRQRDEQNTMLAVGAVGGLDVVVRAVGQLPQARAVDVDLVEVERMLAALAVGEEDLLAVVVDLRIADAALGVVEEHLQLRRCAGSGGTAGRPRRSPSRRRPRS